MKITIECKDREGQTYGMHMMVSRKDAESENFNEIVDSFVDSYARNFNKKLGYDPIDLQLFLTDEPVEEE